MIISKDFRFEAAHVLPHVPTGHKCGRVHGHSFRVTIEVAGAVDPRSGWVLDFADIGLAMRPLLERLDHRYLNDVEGLENPTSEVIAAWLWARLQSPLPGLYGVLVAETCTSRVRYRGDGR